MEELLTALHIMSNALCCVVMSASAYLILTLIEDIHEKRKRFRRLWRNQWRDRSTDVR